MHITKSYALIFIALFVQNTYSMRRSPTIHNLPHTLISRPKSHALALALENENESVRNTHYAIPLEGAIVDSLGHDAIREGDVVAFEYFVNKHYKYMNRIYDLQGKSLMGIWYEEWEKTKQKQSGKIYSMNGKRLKLQQMLGIYHRAMQIKNKEDAAANKEQQLEKLLHKTLKAVPTQLIQDEDLCDTYSQY